MRSHLWREERARLEHIGGLGGVVQMSAAAAAAAADAAAPAAAVHLLPRLEVELLLLGLLLQLLHRPQTLHA